MDGSTRRTRFEARIAIERDFLTKINAIFGHSVPLAGMTRDAIDSWVERSTVDFGGPAVKGIGRILIEASTRAELLADNSKDVFEVNQRPRPDSLKELLRLLDIALADVASEQNAR